MVANLHPTPSHLAGSCLLLFLKLSARWFAPQGPPAVGHPHRQRAGSGRLQWSAPKVCARLVSFGWCPPPRGHFARKRMARTSYMCPFIARFILDTLLPVWTTCKDIRLLWCSVCFYVFWVVAFYNLKTTTSVFHYFYLSHQKNQLIWDEKYAAGSLPSLHWLSSPD